METGVAVNHVPQAHRVRFSDAPPGAGFPASFFDNLRFKFTPEQLRQSNAT